MSGEIHNETYNETLTLRVQHSFAEFTLDLSEEIALSGVTAIFGPSGSGKSTLLRIIAGFETPQSGRIALGNEVMFDSTVGINLAPHKRAIGFMFQDTRLFPHLHVRGNLEFAEKRSRQRGRIDRTGLVEALDLTALLHRNVASLSGGERQRVALARTLLTGPRLLLLDEPLTALDRVRKAEILPYLEKLPIQFGVPTLYVSHDVDEIAELSDRALVLAAGQIQFHGSIAAALERLDLQTLAGRFDAGVLVEGKIKSHDARLGVTYLDLGGDTLTMPLNDQLAAGTSIRLKIRARDVAIATRKPEAISIRNILAGTLIELIDDAPSGFVDTVIRTRTANLRARLTRAAVEDLGLIAGTPVFALIKTVTFDRSA